MADTRSGSGLQTIFGFFLGLMVTAFVGVGVYTFHPSPEAESRARIERLLRAEQTLRESKAPADLTPQDRARLQEFVDERNGLEDASRTAREEWGRRTSIILVVLATLAMAVSVVRAVQLPVISNGLLLGGVFTMLYGVGWIIATGTSTARFGVLTLALAITIALGYLRFVHQRIPAPAGAVDAVSPGHVVSDLERRVRELEERVNEAASALGRKGDRSG